MFVFLAFFDGAVITVKVIRGGKALHHFGFQSP